MVGLGLRSVGRSGGEWNSDEVIVGRRRVRVSGWVKRVGGSWVEKEHIGRRFRVRYIIWVHKVKSVNSVRICLDF